jgi:glucose/mannose transport system substrate-binding protein
MVVDGRAAFNVMGDWAAGYLSTTKKLAPGRVSDGRPSPGTGGEFMFLADSFGLPKGAPHRDNVVAWLTLLGSKRGQRRLQPAEGIDFGPHRQ